jgi:putative flippase GtrA
MTSATPSLPAAGGLPAIPVRPTMAELVRLGLGVLCLLAVGAVGTRSGHEVLGIPRPLSYLAGAALLLLFGACVLLGGRPLLRALELATRPFAEARAWNSWTGLLLFGLALRCAWHFAFPSPPTSDSVSYLDLAGRLARGEGYVLAGNQAYWPPGYPLLLAPFAAVFDLVPGFFLVFNSLLHVATHALVWALAARQGPASSRLAAFLLAVWPGLVAGAGLAGKENVLMVLLPLALWLLRVGTPTRGILRPIGAGLALGAATLVQPSCQLFLAVGIAGDWLARRPLGHILRRGLLILLGMATVIAPWTLRNREVLGETVLVATNGGQNFYRANNPKAKGGYMAPHEAAVDLGRLPELEADREGWRLGRAWIAEKPLDFLRLAAWKQVLFLGDDAANVFESLKRGRGMDGAPYAAARGAATGFWLLLWAALALLFVRRRLEVVTPEAQVAAMGFAYFLAIHAVFESSAKYHIPVVPLLAVAAGTAFARHAFGSGGNESAPAPLVTRTATFVAIGALATAVQYAILFPLEAEGMEETLASSIGYAAAAVLNYLLNRRLTFASDVAHRRAAPRFIVVAGTGLGVNALLLGLFSYVLRLPLLPSQILATAGVLVWNYLGHARWTFREESDHGAVSAVARRGEA